MRIFSLPSFLIRGPLVCALALLSISSGFARESRTSALVYEGDVLRLTQADIAAMRTHPTFVFIPKNLSPYDVRVQVDTVGRPGIFEDVQVLANSDPSLSVWWSGVRSHDFQREDYYLTLKMSGVETHGTGHLEGSRLLHWQQNTEYRLVALVVPKDASDPSLNLILEDQLVVSLSSTPVEDRAIPLFRPTFAFHPASVGASFAAHSQRASYKLSVSAGYGLLSLPFAKPEATEVGFLRLQIRFR